MTTITACLFTFYEFKIILRLKFLRLFFEIFVIGLKGTPMTINLLFMEGIKTTFQGGWG